MSDVDPFATPQPTLAPGATPTPAPTLPPGATPTPAPSPTPTPSPPPSSLAFPVPADGQCYHGVFACYGTSAAPLPAQARTDLQRFVSNVGKSVYLAENAGTICVNEGFWPMSGTNSWKPLMDEGLFDVFIFSINPYLRSYPSDSDSTNGPSATEWKITQGVYDSWLATLAQQTKDFGYPVLLKIGVEMNGNQGLGSWVADYGADPDAFKACWQYIVNYFASADVDNVDWCISYTWEHQGSYGFEDYYPGDAYVDWLGVDFYQISIPDDPAYQFSNFRYWAQTYHPSKPVSITEWGMNWYNKNYPDADRARYCSDFFDLVESYSMVKMIRYHWNGPWLFQSDDPSGVVNGIPNYMPVTTSTYANRIANGRYIG